MLTRRLDPAGLNLTTTTQYDGQGRAVKVTDAAGTATSYVFDAKGQLRDTIVDDVSGGLRLKTSSSYDAQGRTLTVIEGAGTAAARTVEYRYDVLGRRTHEIVDPAGLALTTTYEYDKAGNVVLRRDALANATRYVYDNAGRLQYSIDATGGVTERSYDAEGQAHGGQGLCAAPEREQRHPAVVPGRHEQLAGALAGHASVPATPSRRRCVSSPRCPISGAMFLGDVGGADPYDNDEFTLQYGSRDADGWQTLTLDAHDVARRRHVRLPVRRPQRRRMPRSATASCTTPCRSAARCAAACCRKASRPTWPTAAAAPTGASAARRLSARRPRSRSAQGR